MTQNGRIQAQIVTKCSGRYCVPQTGLPITYIPCTNYCNRHFIEMRVGAVCMYLIWKLSACSNILQFIAVVR